MNLYKLFFCLLLLALSNSSTGQIERCASGRHFSILKSQKRVDSVKTIRPSSISNFSRISADSQVFIIPVVFHIIYNENNNSITDAQVHEQLQRLNQDFRRYNEDTVKTPQVFRNVSADVEIDFVLANRDPSGNICSGIVRKYNEKFSFTFMEAEEQLKKLSVWPTDKYLNIWVADIYEHGITTLGYGTFPFEPTMEGLDIPQPEETDGIVLNYKTLQIDPTSKYKYNLGRTLTHEVGHWLGLFHIFGDEGCSDDYLPDTPLQDTNNLQMTIACPLVNSGCTSNKGDLVMSSNYMDYSPDRCMNLFTYDQKMRMRKLLQVNARRKSVLYSGAYCAPGILADLPLFEGFENTDYLSSINETNSEWKITSSQNMEGNSSLHLGNSNAMYKYFKTPAIKFTNAQNPILEFNVYNDPENPYSMDDTLIISYSSNCINYKTLYIGSGPELNHLPETQSSPPGWRKIEIDLKEIAPGNHLEFSFGFKSKNENIIYIDNLKFHDPSIPLAISMEASYKRLDQTLTIVSTLPADMHVIIFNLLGEIVQEADIQSETLKKVIPIQKLNQGLYFITGISQGKRHTSRLLIQ